MTTFPPVLAELADTPLLIAGSSDRVVAEAGLSIEAESDLRTRKSHVTAGRVLLVGAGPGDPELLTLKAVRALKTADVILYDDLIGPGIVELARREAMLIPVGKRCGQHSARQADINALIVSHALAGKSVVRLKGGDPLVFGRAAEELSAVQAAGIEVEIIPGITAAQGCAASIGLPLTLRGGVRQISLLTGTAAGGGLEPDWEGLAQPGQAFAIYMGSRTAAAITRKLLAAGAAPWTPAIIVENGTRGHERVIATRLETLPAAVGAAALAGPALLLIGLDWSDAGLARPSHVEDYAPARSWSPHRRPSRSESAFAPVTG